VARIRSIKPEQGNTPWPRAEFNDLIGRGGALVYRLLDANHRLLYVGVSTNPRERLRNHAIEKPWWSQVERIVLIGPLKNHKALDLERAIIKSAHPAYNVRSAVRP
jgi:excinuclease UvrABC nuclease subunit